MRDVFQLEPTTTIDRADSYVLSYRAIVNHFRSISEFSVSDFVLAAHAVYGWMPTILELGVDNLEELEAAVIALNHARRQRLSDEQIEELARVVNGSLVGAIKLLHFTAPDFYALWDSNVYGFVFENRKPHHYRLRDVRQYREFERTLQPLLNDSRFPQFHERVNEKVGYPVSRLRALDLVMFLNSGPSRLIDS